MAETTYIDDGPLNRVVLHVLQSVGLVSSDNVTVRGEVGDLLQEGRRNRLPFALVWDTYAPIAVRALALRQNVLLAVIPCGLITSDLAAGLGLLWVGMRSYEAMTGCAYFGAGLPEALGNMILLGGLKWFGKMALLSLALATLCRPMRTAQAVG